MKRPQGDFIVVLLNKVKDFRLNGGGQRRFVGYPAPADLTVGTITLGEGTRVLADDLMLTVT